MVLPRPSPAKQTRATTLTFGSGEEAGIFLVRPLAEDRLITNLSEDLRAGLARLTEAPGPGDRHSIRIATQATQLCVAAFADLCAIYLRSGGAESAAFASRDAELAPLRGLPHDDLYRERAKTLGIAGLLEEPLTVKGRRIGTLVVGFSTARGRNQISATLISLIASIIATAIEQAEELEHHYLISKRLQNALLPTRLADTSHMNFDAAYRPASDEADVGGDWYDAFDIGNGTIGISVGDVTGHGLEAAVAMSEIRRAIRAAAPITDSPSALLNHVDAIVSGEGVGMATAVVGVYDPMTGVLRYASAGHPPPVLLSDGKAHLLPAGGLLLGLGTNPASGDYWVTLSPGTTCFLYTDGLLEYDRDVIAGERALLAAVETIAAKGDCGAEALHREIFADAINTDDCATLTLQRPERVDLSSEHLGFSALPMCAPLARHAVRYFCTRNGVSEDRSFEILTAVGEAIANAIEHGDRDAERPFTIDLHADDDAVVASIESNGHWRPFNAREERGRGIPIMRWCSSGFEISSAHDRTRITLTFARNATAGR